MRHVLSVAVAAALIFAAGWLAWIIVPTGRAIRIRNAFLLRRGREENFAWTPATAPLDYRVEAAAPPAEIERALAKASVPAIGDDWTKARAIVTMLVSHSRHPGAIRADLSTTFRRIREGSGYCADYVRVFLAAASGAGLFSRQWAFSFDGFGGHGHTFVEVFDRQRDAWAFLDVHNNVYAVLADSKRPLSALELHHAILESPSKLRFLRVGPGPLGFRHSDKLLDYYRRGVGEWYLWWGNDVITRDATILPRRLVRMIGPLMHRLRSALGRLPPIVVWTTPENDARVTKMEQLRRRVIGAVVAIGLLGILLLAPYLSALFESLGNA